MKNNEKKLAIFASLLKAPEESFVQKNTFTVMSQPWLQGKCLFLYLLILWAEFLCLNPVDGCFSKQIQKTHFGYRLKSTAYRKISYSISTSSGLLLSLLKYGFHCRWPASPKWEPVVTQKPSNFRRKHWQGFYFIECWYQMPCSKIYSFWALPWVKNVSLWIAKIPLPNWNSSHLNSP